MLRVGLTGGIGSGKSTVAGRFAEHGAVLIDSDRIAREVVEPGTPGLAELAAAFGEGILTEDGALDRARLAAVAFSDDEQRARLNAIIHPRIGARTAELLAEAADDAIVVHDVPLLVENGMAPGYHLVVVVHAEVEQRVHRLTSARGMTEADARARIATQATDEQRRAVADVWLDNSATPDRVLAEVDRLWADRLVSYEANIRLRRKARYGTPRLVDPDPGWPAQATRLAARIAVAAGDRAMRVDHVGSTAVPGLPAKDVIDLQLTVASMDDADAIASALIAAGFPRGRHHRDRPKPSVPDPAQWVKRLHYSADPGRPANLHIRAAGTAGWRYALLVRDWLRADAAARADYLTLKRELVERFAIDDNTARYADAKEPWFDEALSRADDWARRTGWRPE